LILSTLSETMQDTNLAGWLDGMDEQRRMDQKSSVIVRLRPVVWMDLGVFFQQQLDPLSNRMAAFTSKNATDRTAFDQHWAKILGDAKIVARTILADKQIAGYVLHHSWFGDPEVSYWLGREFWGKGIATRALELFLRQEQVRPLYGRVATDNIGSRRVMEKNGFRIIGEDKGFSNARGEEVEEYILVIRQ
jgi:RimJ/RimL family protein N-acetyltransferase